jgi:3-oxoacyl-[acyl-carrier protein] reductase
MGKLAGRVAIVTGGGRGIGRATAERFAEEGAKVVIQTRSAEPGEAAVKAITEAGGEAILVVSDIGKREACRQIVRRAVDAFGQLDIVLHNAAYAEGGMLDTTEDRHLDETFEVGLKPCFWLTVDALPYLEKSPAARILVTSSVTGNQWVTPGRGAYSAMKCGVTGFVRSTAIELAHKRITCNAVEPGLTLTDSVDRMIPPDILQQMESGIPLGRAVYAREIADAFVYLASDDAAMMTGQSLTIDGGATLGFAQAMAFDDH